MLLAAIIAIVDEEPELSDEMPDEMFQAIQGDKDAITEVIRIAVRLTKQGIRDRLSKVAPVEASPWVKVEDRLPRISGPGMSDDGPFDGDVVDGVLVIAGGMVYQGYPIGDNDSWHIVRLGLSDPPTYWMPIPPAPDLDPA